MITYAWRTRLDPDEAAEVRDLVTEAAEYDREAGFARVVPPATVPVVPGLESVRTSHLLVRIRPVADEEVDSDRWPLAAYQRLDVSAGIGSVQFVVRPEFRSLGVATLVFEKLDLPPSAANGWRDTGAGGLVVWAYGNHPAADRMARRFDATPARRMWNLVRKIDGRGELDDRGVAVGGIGTRTAEPGDVPAIERIEQRCGSAVSPRGREHLLGDCAVLVAVGDNGNVLGAVRLSGGGDNGAPRGATGVVLGLSVLPDSALPAGRALLDAALDHFARFGLRRAQLYVDADDESTVRIARALRFEHDRSDLCYVVGAAA